MKLSTKTKDLIRHTAIDKSPFKQQADELKERGYALAEAVYDDVFKDTKELMYSLPEDFLATRDRLNVIFQGTLYGIGYCNGIRFFEDKRMPYRMPNLAKTYTSDDDLWHIHEVLSKDMETHVKELREARAQINAVLGSVSTVSQLLKLWPEVKPILNEIMGTPSERKYLAIPLDDLNKTLNLGAK